MTESIVTALITGGLTLMGVIISNNRRQAVTEVTGRPAVVTGVPSGCDSRVWRSIAGCPTLQLGPGDPGWCHTVNEHISLDSYLETILIYARMILDWGGNNH